MGWLDELLSSSFIVWFIIGIGILHVYMRRTGKTFLDIIQDIREFFSGLVEEQDDRGTIK